MIQLIVFLPLLAATIVGLNASSISHRNAQLITSGALVISALLSCAVFYNVVIDGEVLNAYVLRWIDTGDFSVDWRLRVDSLTAVMLIVVTGVSALVHIYSVGYMSHDPHVPRFMSYLSLFTFCMLMLVTSDNFMQLFFGWEGVGLCSYLLIGFWYKKDSARAAAMKAFIVNRVGDFGFILGIIAIYMMFGSLSYDVVFSSAHRAVGQVITVFGYDFEAVTLMCVLLFIGAMGKSAQLGLHTWLPDAMEGPTPVSALIHAATMVTAGVFLVARCSPLFELSEFARDMVTYVGAATAIFAATIAVTQNDIKRVIAYSTCSQLGYMFFACGVSAYAAGVFHLMTHGFFKALLFLGAGSVIHAMSDEQDMRKMGGIYKHIPLTYAMMLIGTLAITGFPLLSGYYSKDMILNSVYAASTYGQSSANFAFWIGMSAALLTAFYSWRLIFLTFHGAPRASEQVMSHIHESPKVMTVPLIILSVGAVFAGAVFANVFGIVDADLSFWHESIVMIGDHNVLEGAENIPSWVMYLSKAVGVIGFGLAFIMYWLWPKLPAICASIFKPIYLFSYNKWYIDELYDLLFVRSTKALGSFCHQIIDVRIIDAMIPNGAAKISDKLSIGASRLQNGLVYAYAFAMLIGMIFLVGYVLHGF